MDYLSNVSLAALESALSHLQEANRRLAKLLALALIIVAVLFGAVMYFLMNFEIVTTDVQLDAHDGAANYIGNDGDINNGTYSGD